MIPSSERAPARGAPTIGLGYVIGSFKSRCVTENLTYIKENVFIEAETTFPLYVRIEVSKMNYNSYYHHRRSIRLKEYDYSSAGLYFITMCSFNRENIFTNLHVRAGLAPAHSYVSDAPVKDVSLSDPFDNTAMDDVSGHSSISLSSPDLTGNKLTRIGKILDNQWNKLPFYFKNITLDEYVVMPDHFHGIIGIGQDQNNNQNLVRDATTTTENIDFEGVNSSLERAPARGAPTIGLGSVIGAFKSRCVTENLTYIKENGLNELGKFWQRNYYERIIKNYDELNIIRNYIWNNPKNLLLDEEKLMSSSI